MRKGKALLPWESYRDWLRLMVHYFDAAKVLTSFFMSLELCHLPMPTISIMILSPPLPDHEMLTWTKLLGTEHFFPTVPGRLSGKDFIEFLQTSDIYKDSPTHKNVKDVIELAQRLIKKLKSDRLIPDILTEIDTFAQEVKKKCASTDWHDVIEAILALKDSQPLDRLVKMQAIGDMIGILSKNTSFYNSLKHGPLSQGNFIRGTHHCKAYIASLLNLVGSGQCISSLEDILDRIKMSCIFMHCLNLC